VRRLAIVLVAVLALSACGSSGGKSSDSDQVKAAYEKFFSSKAPASDRIAVLQNGSQFQSVFNSFAKNPLASNTSATVSSVTLDGPNKATVVYVVKIAGSALPKQTGSAVRQNGTWKVSDASLCKLIKLSGTTPSACKS
jgi:hypothetical protein